MAVFFCWSSAGGSILVTAKCDAAVRLKYELIGVSVYSQILKIEGIVKVGECGTHGVCLALRRRLHHRCVTGQRCQNGYSETDNYV